MIASVQVEMGGDYQEAVDITISRVILMTGRLGNNYLTSKAVGKRTCYAQAVCDGSLQLEDCLNCLRAANMELIQACSFPLRGEMILAECFIKFQDVLI